MMPNGAKLPNTHLADSLEGDRCDNCSKAEQVVYCPAYEHYYCLECKQRRTERELVSSKSPKVS